MQATDKDTDDSSSDSSQGDREAPVCSCEKYALNTNLCSLNETHIRCPAQTLLRVSTKIIRNMMLLVRNMTGGQGKKGGDVSFQTNAKDFFDN